MAPNCCSLGAGWLNLTELEERLRSEKNGFRSPDHVISSCNDAFNPWIHRRESNHRTIHKPAVPLKRNTASISTAAVNDEISAIITSDPAQAEITWQIVLGALAGVTPFVVAGIEFSKRINCKVCKGSGLVLRDKKILFSLPSLWWVFAMTHGEDSLLVRYTIFEQESELAISIATESRHRVSFVFNVAIVLEYDL